MRILENEELKVSIADQGAELCSVFDKSRGTERIWTADPAVWNRHAPVLFPFVGKVTGGKYRIDGQEYEMNTQHGFARDLEFRCVEETKSTVTHVLEASHITKKIYPYEFKLQVRHCLCSEKPKGIKVEWTIENCGKGLMYYSIGGHPGFLMPKELRKEDCMIAFPGCEELRYFSANSAGFALPEKEHVLKLDAGTVQYQKDIPDTWIFDGNQVKTVGIINPDGEPLVMMDCTQFPMLAVWANPKGNFICLEPWFGRTDDEGFNGTLAEKPGMESLEQGEQKKISYSIDFC